MASVYGENGEKPQYWFNLKTLRVEIGRKSAAPYRVGPFDSEAEASAALKLLRERSEKWTAEDNASD
jgi:hypothetical protein